MVFIFPNFSEAATSEMIVADQFFAMGNKPVIIKDGKGKPDNIIIDNGNKPPFVVNPGSGSGPVPVPLPGNGFTSLLILILVFLSLRRNPN